MLRGYMIGLDFAFAGIQSMLYPWKVIPISHDHGNVFLLQSALVRPFCQSQFFE
jgi:hypothetical protein